ncbi:MAG: hypothetical protein WCF84_26295 [Anaerolineae bacterium]
MNLTPDQLSGLAAVVASLAFAYVPGLREWFDARTSTQKAGIMGLTLVVIALGALAAACTQLLDVGIACSKSGITTLIANLVAALMANQGAYMLFVRSVKRAGDAPTLVTSNPVSSSAGASSPNSPPKL